MEQIALGKLGMTPEELGNMEPRELTNKILGFNKLELERRLWHAWVMVSTNPYSKEKPGTFDQFCKKMTGDHKNNIKLSPEQFFRIIGAK